MKKIHLSKSELITFEESCNRYIDYCRYRNLREGTIRHYRQSFLNFFRNIDKDMLIRDFNKDTYNNYVIKLKNTLHNDVSISILHFAMNKEWVQPFKMETIKVDSTKVKTYSDDELRILLKKPDLKSCNFTEYSCWVMTSFLFSTGVRQRSLINIKIKDVDFINSAIRKATTSGTAF